MTITPPELTGDPAALTEDGPADGAEPIDGDPGAGPFDDPEGDAEERRVGERRRKKSKTLFQETAAEEEARERQRQLDRQVGLLIGPKNLEKLRGFGWDVRLVNPDHRPLTPGTAHAGMTT